MKAVFWLVIMALTQISRLHCTFQAIKNLSAHPSYLCFEPFCKFFGDFKVYLELNSFSQRISKIYGNRKLKIGICTQTVVQQPGVPLWGQATVCRGSIPFFPFQSLFKLP